MCFWNAPLDIQDHALCAVKVAEQCRQTLAALRPEFERKYGVTLETRIGIHTGFAVVGNFGSAKRFDYTVIGDAPNLASRLEGANKIFGTHILISDQTRAKLPDNYAVRRAGQLLVIGRKEPVTVWEVFAEKKFSEDALEMFERGREAFEAGRAGEARILFAELSVNDELSHRYLQRLERELPGLEAAPPDWSPTWQQDKK